MDENLVSDPFDVHIIYRFMVEEERSYSFSVNVNLAHIPAIPRDAEGPFWTRLDCHQCTGCPLDKEKVPYCPAAWSLKDIIESMGQEISFASSVVEIELEGRSIRAEKNLQDALFPLIGLRMAVSGCPFLAEFRPMARFHEPFSSPFRTAYRATSLFLMKKVFGPEGEAETPALEALKAFYENITTVNAHMVKRLREANVNDAAPNSIVILDIFGMSMTFLFDEYQDAFKELFNLPPPL